MQRKYPLDADPVGNLPHGKRRPITPAIHLDHNSLEGLDTFLFALDHLDLQAQGVANAKNWQVGTQTAVFDLLNYAVHGKPIPPKVSLLTYRMIGAHSTLWSNTTTSARLV